MKASKGALLLAVLSLALVPARSAGQESPLYRPSNLPTGNFLGNGSASTTTESPEDWLERAERERREREARSQFEAAVLSLAEEKGEQEYAKEARDQAAAFTKEFLKLDLDASEFVDRFEELLEKYPLAIEDPFAAKLIRKGENAARRADPDRAKARLEKTRSVARQALDEHIRVLREQNPSAPLEADTRYLQLKEALERMEETTPD